MKKSLISFYMIFFIFCRSSYNFDFIQWFTLKKNARFNRNVTWEMWKGFWFIYLWLYATSSIFSSWHLLRTHWNERNMMKWFFEKIHYSIFFFVCKKKRFIKEAKQKLYKRKKDGDERRNKKIQIHQNKGGGWKSYSRNVLSVNHLEVVK